MIVIGVISDTHRQIPDKALQIFRGEYDRSQVIKHWGASAASADVPMQAVDYIIHAGDIGELDGVSQKVLDELSRIAPVYAVLGNRDLDGYQINGKPVTAELLEIDLDGLKIAVMHEPKELRAALKASEVKPDLSIHGHEHKYDIQQLDSEVRVCPGSIRDPRDDTRRAVALAYVEDGKLLRVEIVRL